MITVEATPGKEPSKEYHSIRKYTIKKSLMTFVSSPRTDG